MAWIKPSEKDMAVTFSYLWDSRVISSLGFQLELSVSLPCSEGLAWVVTLISAGLIYLEIGFGWKFAKLDSPGSSHLEGKLLVAEAYPGGW